MEITLSKYGHVPKFWSMKYKEKCFLELTGRLLKENRFRWKVGPFVLSSFHLCAVWGEEGIARAKKAILNHGVTFKMEATSKG